MSTETSARLLSKLILILTLCQLGFEFKSQSIAQKLPVEEERALYAVTSKLSSRIQIISDYRGVVCKNGSRKLVSNGGDVIGTCNCKFQNGTTCHITEIKMDSWSLDGSISEEVVYLKYLEKLDLSNNQLTGSIPVSLGNLCSLSTLDLSSNKLTGSIPENLGNMKFQVKFLNLRDNQLSGTIPTTLENVVVSSVTSDPVAYRLFKRKQYDRASVDDSSFFLNLSFNQLTGPIPESLGNLTFTSAIVLCDNFLNGSIPASLGALTYLQLLALFNNEISGTLPQTLANLTGIVYLYLDSNSITGILPKSFASLTKMMGL